MLCKRNYSFIKLLVAFCSIRSKLFECCRTDPEWDIAADNLSMKAIVQERNNAPIHEMQERMREEAKVDAKQNKKRIEEIRKMQERLRQKFIDANNFISECEGKKADIEKKIAIEEATGRKLDAEIKEYKERLERMEDYHENELKPKLAKQTADEENLQKVATELDFFHSKEDFLDRMKALGMSNCLLVKFTQN